MDSHRRDNLANWESRVPIHAGPDGYNLTDLVDDPDYLTEVVAFDRPHLGDVSGKTLLHLQCHIGTDTLSWAKLGARVTGLDFSPSALAVCRELASRMEVEADFIESDIYRAPEVLKGTYDIVYTGIGAINWLPDIRQWAGIVAGYVRPGGMFYIREGHPVLQALDQDREDDLLVLTFPYFERAEPTTWAEDTTYSGTGKLANPTTREWNHGLGEIITALIDAGLRIDRVDEHRFIDWPTLPHMIKTPIDYVLPEHQRELVPLEFTIVAHKELADG